jgi:hypothetical protein
MAKDKAIGRAAETATTRGTTEVRTVTELLGWSALDKVGQHFRSAQNDAGFAESGGGEGLLAGRGRGVGFGGLHDEEAGV